VTGLPSPTIESTATRPRMNAYVRHRPNTKLLAPRPRYAACRKVDLQTRNFAVAQSGGCWFSYNARCASVPSSSRRETSTEHAEEVEVVSSSSSFSDSGVNLSMAISPPSPPPPPPPTSATAAAAANVADGRATTWAESVALKSVAAREDTREGPGPPSTQS